MYKFLFVFFLFGAAAIIYKSLERYSVELCKGPDVRYRERDKTTGEAGAGHQIGLGRGGDGTGTRRQRH